MRGAMVVLAVLCAALGLAPVFFWPAIAPAVEALEYLQDLAKFAPEGILNASSGSMRARC